MGLIRNLILINVVVFLTSMLNENIFYYFGLNDYVFKGELWRLVSYAFLHAGFGHLFFNMLGLYMFGSEVVYEIGERNFLKMYIIAVIIGAVLHVAISSIFFKTGLTVGASGGVYAVLTSFAVFNPYAVVYVFFILPLKAWFAVTLFVIFDILGGISGRSVVAHFVHIGGALTGLIFTLIYKGTFYRLLESIKDKLSGSYRIDVAEEEIDRILDKILIYGVNSLTKEEKRKLDEYSKKARNKGL